jgi:phenylacetate-CoA ligase
LEDFLQAYRKLKPSLLGGYVGGVEFFAQHVLEKELSIPAPKLTWVSSAPVTDVQRQTLRRAFSAPVLDQYGCCEIYWLAAQCPQSRGLHFFLDGRFIEFLDDKNRTVPKTQLGRIALTDLENYAFPLIRYVNEDEGRWLDKTCACGRPFPLIDAVRGRVTERVLLPNGTCLSGDYLTTIFDNFPQSVKQFQLHQQEDYSIRLKVVPNDKHAEAEQEIREVESILREKTQGLAAIEIQKVPRIPHDRGKTRFIISDIE